MIRSAWIGLLFAAIAGPCLAADVDHPWRRWAVVCSRELQQEGLGDLATIELGKVPGIELVERDALDKVQNELVIGDLLGAGGAAGRLKLGRMLKADALVLMECGPGAKSPRRLVIADCLYGARLHQQELAAGPAAAAEVAKIVQAAQKRFPHGLRILVGVPNFVNRSLTHEHDAFQSGYAELLAAALSLEPGTAVLEIEEARAIARELAGQPPRGIHTPLIIEGEFRVDAVGAAASATVIARLTGGTASRELRSPSLPLLKVPQWIAEQVVPVAIERSSAERPLPLDAQVKLLVARADEFSQLGAFLEAIKLRDAVVMLAPAEAEQRTKRVAEAFRWISGDSAIWMGMRIPTVQDIDAKVGRRVDMQLAQLEHLEYLIRNRQIERGRALDLVWTVTPYNIGGPFAQQVRHRPGQISYWYQEHLERAQDPVRRFFLEVVPKILDLPLGRNEPRNQILESLFLSRWQDHFIGGVRRRVDVPYLTPRDLADLARAYTEILPENLPIGQMRLPTASLIEDPRAATEEDYDAFYRTVAASKHNTSSLRGRFTLLENQLKVAQMTPTVRALHGIARRVAKIIRRASKPLTAAV